MAQVESLYIDEALSQVSIEATNNRFMHQEIAPVVRSSELTGKIFRLDKEQESKRDFDSKRRPGAEARFVDDEVDSSTTFVCIDHSLAGLVPDEAIAQAEAPAQPAINKVQRLSDILRLEMEIELVADLDTNLTGSMTSNPTNEWDDYTNGDPFIDINTQITTTLANSGAKPNALAMDESLLRVIMHHPDFLDRIKYTGMGANEATASLENAAEALRRALGLLKVDFADVAMKNTAAKGQTAALATVWSDRCLLYKWEPPAFQTSLMAITVVFDDGAIQGGLVDGFKVETDREARRKSDIVIVTRYYDYVFFKPDGTNIAAHLFTDRIT